MALNPLLDIIRSSGSSARAGALAIDQDTPLPEQVEVPYPQSDVVGALDSMDLTGDSTQDLAVNEPPAEPAPMPKGNPLMDIIRGNAPAAPTLPKGNPLLAIIQDNESTVATQQAVAEATTPTENLPVLKSDLANALGVLDYRDPEEGQRRQQAAAMGEILGLPEYEKVQLGAAPVNTDGTVTIRRAQAVSPEANAAAAAKLQADQAAAASLYKAEQSALNPSFLDKLQQRWRVGREQAVDDQLAYRAMMGEVDYEKVKGQLDPSAAPLKGGNWLSEGVLTAAQMLPAMVDGIISGNSLGLQGAMAGGTAAAIAGQVGPQVVTPEEIVTVPATAALGYAAGTAAGSAEYWYKQGAGSMYHQLRKEGVPHNVSSTVAASFGAPYAAIELAQVSKLVPGVKQTAAQAVAGGIKSRLTALAKEKGVEYVEQIGQETTQELLSISGEKLAEWSAGVTPPKDKASAWERIASTIQQTATSIPFLMAPKAAVDTYQTVRGNEQAAAAPAEVPQNFTPISTPVAAPATTRPRSLGEVRAPQIAVDQAAIDEAFGSPFAPPAVNPQVNPAEVSNDTFAPPATGTPPVASAPAASATIAPEPTGSPELIAGEGASIPTPPRPAYSFSTDAITPEQTALAADFSARLTNQLGTQGVIDSGSSLTLTPVNLDRVDAGAGLSDFIDTFSRLTETRIQFVKPSDPTIFGGAVRSDDAKTIFLNAESQRPVAALIGHEWGHSLQYTQPALYKDLRRVVATYTDNYRSRARESAASPIYRSGSASQRARTQAAELTNNTLGDAFLDPSFWESVRNENKPLVQKLWTSFNEWVDSLLNRQSQSTFGTPQFATDLTAMRRDLAKTIAPALRPPTKSFGNAQITNQPGLIDLAIEAYHGTPHKVDRFSTEKIGTGEGAQAYGWGLYFAQERSVGEEYRNALSSYYEVNNRPLMRSSEASDVDLLNAFQDINLMAELVKSKDSLNAGLVADRIERRINQGGVKMQVVSNSLELLKSASPQDIKEGSGNLYTVELDSEPEDLLDWDKPLSEQSEKVQAALAAMNPDYRPDSDEYDANEQGQMIYSRIPRGFSGNAKVASEKLLAAGIKGIRYLDGGSRSERQGTYNYVAFDENLIKIKAENGQPVSRGIAFAQEGSQPDPAPTVIPSISFAAEDRYKPTDIILSPAGHQDWGVFTDLDEARSKGKLKSLPIRILKGKHFGPNKGYGIEHIRAEHEQDFAAFQEPLENVLHRLLLDFNEVYLQPNGRLTLLSRRPTIVSIIELREDKGGYYSVVTGFPNKNPSWKPAGVRILDGRRAAFAQSARAPGPTAQGNVEPNPPLESLPGKYSVEYAMSLRRPVNKNVDGNISAAAEPKPRKFTQSVQAAEGVMPEVKAQLNSFEYDPVSNAETVASARAGIDAAGSIDAAFTGLMGKTAAPEWQPSAVDYATGIELLGQLQNRGRHEDAGAIANMMANRATDQGRAIQALSMISRLGPQGIEVFAQRQLTQAATSGKTEKQRTAIQGKIDEADQLRGEVGKVRHGAATAAIVGNKDLIKGELPAGVDPVKVNLAIRDAIIGSPTPLAAEAATHTILTAEGLSDKGAVRISKSVVKDFLKTSQDSRAKVLQDLQAAAENDRRLDKSKLGGLMRLNREGKLTDTSLHAGMAKMLGIPHWGAGQSAKVQRILAQRDRATDPRIKLVKAAEALDVVYREFMPPGLAAKIDTLQTLAMLLNTKTVTRNVLGNVLAFSGDLAADAVAVPMDALMSLGTGQRTRTGLSLGERLVGLGAGVGDVKAGYQFARSEGRGVVPSLAEGVNTLVRLGRLQSSGKYDSAQISAYSGGTFTAPILRHLESTLGAVLSIADRGFYESAFRSSLDNRMKAARANGTPMLAPDADMITAARMDAGRAVYQNDTAAGQALSGMRRVLNKLSSIGRTERWGLGSLIFKFTQVPGSILHRAVEFSPLGFIGNAYEGIAPLLSKNKEFDQKAFVDSFTRALVGTTGLVATGYWLAHLGIISAGSDAKDEDKRNLDKARGWGNYKLNVDALKRALMTGNFWTRQPQQLNDRTESYDWAQPLSIGVAMGAYARENQDAVREDILRGKRQSLFATGMNWLAYGGGAATGAMNSLIEQPLLKGLNSFFRNATYDGLIGAVVQTAAEMPGSFIPSSARQWMQLTDNSIRETRDSSPFREYVNELKAQLPGLSKTLPQKYDIAGQPVERWAQDSNTIFNVMFNPGMTTYIKGSPVLTEMGRIYEMTANPSAVAKQVKPEFTLEGVKVRLTDEEISAMQKDMGALSVAAVEKFVLEDPRYAKATWDIKAKAFTRALEKAAEAAKYRVLLSRPDLKTRAAAEHRKILQDQAAESKRRAEEFAAMGQLQPGP
jgi:hypothetical protein